MKLELNYYSRWVVVGGGGGGWSEKTKLILNSTLVKV